MTDLLMGLVPPGVDLQGFVLNKVTCDSRQVEPGDIFVALRGVTFNGEDAIPDAVAKGARVVIASQEYGDLSFPGVLVLRVKNPHATLSLLASRFYPQQPATTVAVTGTNGKSSVVHFLRHLWGGLGHASATIGTLGLITHRGGAEHVTTLQNTSPPALEFHRLLNLVADAGITHCALEASSHGLDQHRVTGARLTAAGFTSFSQDHLDYHPDMASYFQAKSTLFGHVLSAGRWAVLNADIPEYGPLKDICEARGCPVLSYGMAGDLRLVTRTPTPQGQDLTLSYGGQNYTIHLPLVGLFQAHNVLCALGLAMACGDELTQLLPHVPHLPCVPGRMELAGQTAQGAPVYVDYAHTPDALEMALKTLRPHTAGRLFVVFGCGGDRDATKRPLMGAAAARYADVVYVTNDNPRTEDPDHIRQQILAAVPTATDISDRRLCIQKAMASLAPGDVLLVAGKGHETGQIIGKTIHPFDDRLVVQDLLNTISK